MTCHRHLVRLAAVAGLLLLIAAPSAEAAAPAPYRPHRLLTQSLIRGYQLLISPGKVSHCPMHPSCSAYGLEAFRTRNPLAALALTSDRLFRCANDLDFYHTTVVDGAIRFADPLSGAATPRLGVGSTAARRPGRPEGMPPAEQSLYTFAVTLQAEGDLERAITEYRRFLIYFPASDWRGFVVLALMDCLQQASHYRQAVSVGRHELPRTNDPVVGDALALRLGAAYLRLGDADNERLYLARAAASDDPDIRGRGLLLQGFALAGAWAWGDAADHYAQMPTDSPYHRRSLACAEVCRRAGDLPRPSPTRAGLLAVIPGLGYWYSGYKQTALSAFLVNAATIWGTYQAFDHGNDGLGVLLGIVGVGWYSGNIYGSIRSARQRAEHAQEELLMQLDLGFTF